MKYIVVVMAVDPEQRGSEQELKLTKDLKYGLDYIRIHKYGTKIEGSKLIIEERKYD